MKLSDIKYIVCDMDNTVTPSASMILRDTQQEILRLSSKYKFIYISGTNFEEIHRLIPLGNCIILGSSGATATARLSSIITPLYKTEMSAESVEEIVNTLIILINALDLPCLSNKNDQILIREGQVTLSCLGRSANKVTKDIFDPEHKFRQLVVEEFNALTNHKYNANIGGSTSVDITEGPMDKKIGLQTYFEKNNISPEECIYFGDSTHAGGNDYPIVGYIPAVITVKDPVHFTEILRRIE